MQNEIDYKQVRKDLKTLNKDISNTIINLFSLNFQKELLEGLLKTKSSKSKE